MSAENENVSIGSQLVFPAVFGSIYAAKSIARNKGLKGAVQSMEIREFKKLNASLKKAGVKDVFTRSTAINEAYEGIQNAAKANYKYSKQVKDGAITLKQKFFNLFRSAEKKVTVGSSAANQAKSAEELKKAKDAIKDGKAMAENIAKTSAKSGFFGQVGKLFTQQLKDPFVLVFTAIEAIPEIKDKIIPAFKEEGFKGGMKQVGKSVLRLGASLLSFTFGSSLGTVVGRVLGTTLLPGIGTWVGGFLGSMLGAGFVGRKVDKAVDKIVGEDDKTQQLKQIETQAAQAKVQAAQKELNLSA